MTRFRLNQTIRIGPEEVKTLNDREPEQWGQRQITNGWRLRGLRRYGEPARGRLDAGEVLAVSKVLGRYSLWRGGSPT